MASTSTNKQPLWLTEYCMRLLTFWLTVETNSVITIGGSNGAN